MKTLEVARFGEKIGLTRIEIDLVVLSPGYRTSLPHCHGKEEEFVFVRAIGINAKVRYSAGSSRTL